ncbi:gluconate 2-dehydrogenase subunit 3 family protein, partial [Listeria monocytogenes]|nr:gluconate 2-dehydrogenase subunit 3 family protein [Listeria monocytogenes]
KANQGKPFAELEPSAQDDILQRLEAGQIDLQDLPAKLLCGQVLQHTHAGVCSEPQHGGNRGLVGWKLVGFPGARADFMD